MLKTMTDNKGEVKMNMPIAYRVLNQEIVCSGLESLIANQMRVASVTCPSFNGTSKPFKLLEFRIELENPEEEIDAQFLTHVCGTDVYNIGPTSNVFEGTLKGETFIITIE
jgi:hypothetical protein